MDGLILGPEVSPLVFAVRTMGRFPAVVGLGESGRPPGNPRALFAGGRAAPQKALW